MMEKSAQSQFAPNSVQDPFNEIVQALAEDDRKKPIIDNNQKDAIKLILAINNTLETKLDEDHKLTAW